MHSFMFLKTNDELRELFFVDFTAGSIVVSIYMDEIFMHIFRFENEQNLRPWPFYW